MFLAERVSWIKASPTVSISVKAKNLAASGIDVIDFGIGEPDFNTPDYIKEAGINAIQNNKTRYTLMNGITPLREQICSITNNDFGTSYSINNVIVAPGAKYVIFNAFMTTINPGDEVIIPAPYWVSYSDIVLLFGGKPVIVQTDPANNFKIRAHELEAAITPKTKWFLINSPSNPTGTIYTKEDLLPLANVLLKHKIWIMTDDIYQYIRYNDDTFDNLVSVKPELINQSLLVNGFSKSFCMTGWRIGYGLAPEELIKAMSKLQSQATSSICQISQEAGFVALKNIDNGRKHFAKMSEIYKKRRDIAVQKLSNIKGLKLSIPDGAFYIFVDIKNILGKTFEGKKITTDEEFITILLEKFHVSVVHGSAFGTPGYFRISFSTTEELLLKGIDRIDTFVNQII